MKQKYLAILGCIGILFGQAIAAAPDPVDPDTAIPASVYVSPFSDYRPLGEDKNTIWKDANDTVGKIGGWRAYAREAAQAMKAREAGQTKKAPGAGEIDKTPPATTAPKMSPALPATTHKHGG